ncbi:MAG: hypothetical protein ACFHWX_02125 [Bacteroidota bacterium]
MKQAILRFYLPLTLVSFELVTKWWYGLAIDAKDVFFQGFPFIYRCEGFHTSMSTQYFILPMIADLLIYFLILFATGQLISRIWKLQTPKVIARIFWIGFGIFFCVRTYFSVTVFDDRYKLNRDFDVAIFGTGISTFGQFSTDRTPYSEQLNNWKPE